MKKYEKIEEGGYGEIFKVKLNNKFYALKKIKIWDDESESIAILREIILMH